MTTTWSCSLWPLTSVQIQTKGRKIPARINVTLLWGAFFSERVKTQAQVDTSSHENTEIKGCFFTLRHKNTVCCKLANISSKFLNNEAADPSSTKFYYLKETQIKRLSHENRNHTPTDYKILWNKVCLTSQHLLHNWIIVHVLQSLTILILTERSQNSENFPLYIDQMSLSLPEVLTYQVR